MNLYPDNDLKKYVEKYKSKFKEDKVLIFSEKDLMGQLANWSIKMSPNVIPNNLEKVLIDFQDHINPYFEKLKPEEFKLMEMDLKKLKKFIHGNLITIKEFKEWNLSNYEKNLNKNYNDKDRNNYRIISKFDKVDNYFDFIDLDALIRNIAWSIYEENEKFENE
jgi:hypothetical protein